jgi:hypothetical protein
MEVFIQKDGQQYGPYTVDEVNDLLESGDLTLEDLARYDGETAWVPLADFGTGVFIQKDGQQYGPYTVDEVNDLLEAGKLMPDDLAWFEGATDWAPLAQLAEGSDPAPESETDTSATVETDPHVTYVPFIKAELERPPGAEAEADFAPEIADPSVGEEDAFAPQHEAYAASEGDHVAEPAAEMEQASHAQHAPLPTALVPGPILVPLPAAVAVTPTVRPQQPPWVPPRRDTSGPLPHPSNMKRSSLAAFSGMSSSTPPHIAAANEPVISEQEAHQMAKKFASQGAMVDPERGAGVRKVLIGGLLFIAGIGVTIISYQESTSKSGAGGLTYVIAWAAIAFGALLFIRGLLQIFGD